MQNKLYAPLFCILITLLSCKKDSNIVPVSEPPLEGHWKMILYIDSTTGVTETKEDSYLHFNPFMSSTPYPSVGDIKMEITFNDSAKTAGSITGNTIYNAFIINFSIKQNKDFLHNYGIWTLALDPPWGMYFYSCMQIANCYSFDEQSRLLIKAPTKTLVFSKE